MLSEEIRELRRILRYRNHIVRMAVNMQNKISGLLMEVGVSYSKKRLHGKKYFSELLERVEEIPPSVKELLQLSRSSYEMFRSFQKRLVDALHGCWIKILAEKSLRKGAIFVHKKRPTLRVVAGLFLILLSYVIGWPAVGVLGAISFYTGKPLFLVVGGPLVYGLSHLVFLIGAYCAGKDYAAACLKRIKTLLRKRNERTN